MRDVVFLHDRLCLISSRKYAEYDFTASFFYTVQRKAIPEEYKVQFVSLRKESPFELGLLLASAALFARTIPPFVQAIRDLVLLPREYQKQQAELRRQPLDRELLVQQIEGMRLENMERRARIHERMVSTLREQPSASRRLTEETVNLLKRDIERIDEHPVTLTDVEVKSFVAPAEGDEPSES